MPLRSVEAATRDDAIAAARDQFGPSARVVGVRKVRSGGVLGFFTSERFVAEVEPETSRPTPAPDARPRQRMSTRNTDIRFDDPVDELAGLFADEAEPAVPTYSRAGARRTSAAPRAPRVPARPAEAPRVQVPRAPLRSARQDEERAELSLPPRRAAAAAAPTPIADDDKDVPMAEDDLAPSPFTAALARMMAGDQKVRAAVAEAVDHSATERSATERSGRSSSAWGATGIDDVRVEPMAAPEPEPMAQETVRPEPAPVAPEPIRVAPEPIHVAPEPIQAEPALTASREEAVAAVLRAALAQGPSDEVLTDIIRGVLGGAAMHGVAEQAVGAELAPEEASVVPTAPPAPLAEVATLEHAVVGIVEAIPERPIEDTPESVTSESVTVESVTMGSVRVDSVRTEVITMTSPGLARTAGDPAPLLSDATTIMPPLSLLPPLPAHGGLEQPLLRPRLGRPPVPPPTRRPAAPVGPSTPPRALAALQAPGKALATVTRLPVAVPDEAEELYWTAPLMGVALRTPDPCAELIADLRALGLPTELLGTRFADDVATLGTYAALTRALAAGLPSAPALPGGTGEVLFVVGPGVETLTAARSLAASLHLDPDRVLWATRGRLAGLAPKGSRVSSVDTAVDRYEDAARAGMTTVVAVDAPLRSDTYWTAQMLSIWSPTAVWAVVDATRKTEDVEPWLDGLQRVDALMVQDTDLSADPAAILELPVPVVLLDGRPATPHRWASLLCERLERHQV